MYFPHPVEEVSGDRRVVYRLKFEGIYLVAEPSGKSSIVSAYFDMQKAKTARKKRGEKALLYDLSMSVKGIQLFSVLTGTLEHQFQLKQVTYCTQQNPYVHYIFFIVSEGGYKEAISGKLIPSSYRCVILKHEKVSKTREIVYTFAECMQVMSQLSNQPSEEYDLADSSGDLSHEQSVSRLPPSQPTRRVTEHALPTYQHSRNRGSASVSQKTPGEYRSGSVSAANAATSDDSWRNAHEERKLLNENLLLKSRLRDLSKLVPSDLLVDYLTKHKLKDICDTDSTSGELRMYQTESAMASRKQMNRVSWQEGNRTSTLPESSPSMLPPPASQQSSNKSRSRTASSRQNQNETQWEDFNDKSIAPAPTTPTRGASGSTTRNPFLPDVQEAYDLHQFDPMFNGSNNI